MGAPARQMSALPAALPARTAPGRRRTAAPGRRRVAPKQHHKRHLVGRTAQAVGHLPESSAVVGISRSRVWIAVIGVLLIGIIAINVITVSYGSMASGVETQIQELERRNSILKSTETAALAMPRVRTEALAAGMAVPAPDEIRYRSYQPGDIAAAAQRLAADGG